MKEFRKHLCIAIFALTVIDAVLSVLELIDAIKQGRDA
ncbi:Uncharacterised protein [Mycobacteroides abscessus subsp. abscessus]|nr:Uncharacterised protein [Mycobacteroides abscessus subsp. abscessus]